MDQIIRGDQVKHSVDPSTLFRPTSKIPTNHTKTAKNYLESKITSLNVRPSNMDSTAPALRRGILDDHAREKRRAQERHDRNPKNAAYRRSRLGPQILKLALKPKGQSACSNFYHFILPPIRQFSPDSNTRTKLCVACVCGAVCVCGGYHRVSNAC